MNTKLLLLVIVLSAFCSAAHSQIEVKNDTVSLKQFELLDDTETLNYLMKTDKDIYRDYLSGCQIRKTGTTVCAVGAFTCAIGFAGTIVSFRFQSDALQLCQTIMIAGGVTTIASIPIIFTGNSKKENARNNFMQKHYKDKKVTTINLQSSVNGIGVALNF